MESKQKLNKKKQQQNANNNLKEEKKNHQIYIQSWDRFICSLCLSVVWFDVFHYLSILFSIFDVLSVSLCYRFSVVLSKKMSFSSNLCDFFFFYRTIYPSPRPQSSQEKYQHVNLAHPFDIFSYFFDCISYFRIFITLFSFVLTFINFFPSKFCVQVL